MPLLNSALKRVELKHMSETKINPDASNLSQFCLNQANFELRTAPNFLHWDRAGAIWTEVVSRLPGLKLQQGEPNKTAFSLGNKYVFSAFLDNSGLAPHTTILGTAYRPNRSMKEFGELLRIFVEIVQRELEIADYTRIGLRLIFTKEFGNRELASKALLKTNLLSVPLGPHFGIDGSAILPEYSVRWEDGKKGVTVRCKVEGLKWEFTPPFDWEGIESSSKESNRLTFDIDYYTLAPVAVGQFGVVEWIDNVLHLINRDSDKFLGGV
jgi:hypothetical protein